MPQSRVYARQAEPALAGALADSPVVLLHGPRQSGKTTLAKMLGKQRTYGYVSFDDDVTRAAAEADPIGFVDGLPERSILDEIQRVPGLDCGIRPRLQSDRAPENARIRIDRAVSGIGGWIAD